MEIAATITLHEPDVALTDFALAIVGVVLTFVAAGIQQGGVDLHPVYFNHNALYHLVQGCALVLIFLAARGVLQGKADARFASAKSKV